MDRKAFQAIAFIALLTLAGCRPKDDIHPAPTNTAGTKVYVVCEGSLGNGNGALSLYFPAKDSVYEDVYKGANGSGVGDVFQSMTRIGDRYFLCINNSDKILCISTGDWKNTGSISIPKPRFILPVSPSKAYVSTLFSNNLYVINPATLQILKTIVLPFKNSEGMAMAGGRALICPWDTAANAIITIDTATDALEMPISLTNVSPSDAVVDADGILWVLTGNANDGKPAKLTKLDAATGAIFHDYSFTGNTDPLRLCFNATRDTLYWIEADYNGGSANNGIYRMSIHSPALPGNAFIPAQSLQYFWAVGIEPASGNIYVGNPLGFTQRGIVSIYTPNGTFIRSFKVGVGPGHFYFEQ